MQKIPSTLALAKQTEFPCQSSCIPSGGTWEITRPLPKNQTGGGPTTTSTRRWIVARGKDQKNSRRKPLMFGVPSARLEKLHAREQKSWRTASHYLNFCQIKFIVIKTWRSQCWSTIVGSSSGSILSPLHIVRVNFYHLCLVVRESHCYPKIFEREDALASFKHLEWDTRSGADLLPTIRSTQETKADPTGMAEGVSMYMFKIQP